MKETDLFLIITPNRVLLPPCQKIESKLRDVLMNIGNKISEIQDILKKECDVKSTD
jgi:hypothetical protein